MAPAGASDPAARALFGDRLALAARYARLLGTDGVVRGLIGPRETERLWDRHLLNCAVLTELIADDAYVVDVGSGAGLPGIVLAIARPDLTVVLIEPLARRTVFLTEAVQELGLGDRVEVLRGRAEEAVSGPLAGLIEPADVVTARAVAPIDRLAGWCLPLTRIGGRLLALKGSTAAEEVATHGDVIERLGGGTPQLLRCGVGILEQPATVVEIIRKRVVDGRWTSGRASSGRSSGRSSSGRTAEASSRSGSASSGSEPSSAGPGSAGPGSAGPGSAGSGSAGSGSTSSGSRRSGAGRSGSDRSSR